MPGGPLMRIADVATELGVSESWLRKLERAGKIPTARRDAISRQRRYTDEDVEAIRAVLFPAEAPPPAPVPVPMVTGTLRTQHVINGVRLGPGRCEVPEKLVPDLRIAEDAAARASA